MKFHVLRSFVFGTVLMLVFFLASIAHAAIAVGSRVSCNDSGVNVRSTAGGAAIGQQSAGVQGSVISGPSSAYLNGAPYTWWQVNFDSGTDGWVAVNYLSEVIASLPTVQAAAATSIGQTTATLKATITNTGGAAVTDARFEYTSSSFPGTVIYSVPVSGSSISYALTGLQPGTTYTFHAFAKNSAGWSSASNNLTFTTTAPTASVPTVQAATPTSIGQTTATLKATITNTGGAAVTDARFEYTSSSFPGTVIYSVPVSGSSISYALTGLQPGTTYTFHAFAKNSAGWSSASNNLTFTTTAPAMPGNFTLSSDPPIWDTSSPAGPAVLLHWTASSNATSYDLYRNGVLYKNGIIGTSFYNSVGLASGQSYTYYVIAKNSMGNKQCDPVTVGPMPGEAPRPDLVIISNSITFTPTTVNVGGNFTLSFTAKNNGAGRAPATIARLRLSADAVLTKYDLPLSPLDAGIPALAAGASYTFTAQMTVPSATPKGQYYVGVFSDADDSAGQSDATNDSSISTTRISVTATGISAPVITSQPVSVTVNSGETAKFSVQAQGSDLSYTWIRFGNEVGNQVSTLALVGVGPSQAGEYWVRVSNAGGSVESSHVYLTVNSTTPPAQNPLGSGSFTPYGTFNPNLPTIVITHGWQPDGEFSITKPPSWMGTMKTAIQTRLSDEKTWPADGSGNRANILLFTWPDAFFIDPWRPFISTDYEGQQLATYLKPLIGGSYSQPIQFIGHSFGTFVNAHAVEKLGISVDQFTILDAPISHEAQVFLGQAVGAYWLDTFFARHLKRYRIGWVDNYIATIPTHPFIFPFGSKVEGSSPYGGMITQFAHEGIQDGFYSASVRGEKDGGFNDSILVKTFNRRPPLYWNPPVSLTEIISDIPDAARFATGEIRETTDTVAGKLQNVLQLIKGGVAQQSMPGSGIMTAATASPQDAALEFDLTVPKRAQQLTFDFLFAQLGDGDWLTVSFNDNLLYNFLGKSFYGANYHQAEIPIANFAGKTGVLTVALHSANATPSELRVGNFKFFAAATGSLKTLLIPSRAADAGAKWRVDNGAWKSSGETQDNLSVGDHVVTFKSLNGWDAPNSQTVSITAGGVTTVRGTYKAIPEIAVKLSKGNHLANRSSTVRFGAAKLKRSISKKFTIKNTGTALLKGISISKSGPHKSNFTISRLAQHSLTPGDSMSFKVTFKPSSAGVREAAIYIASNDANENPFVIWLKGTGTTSNASSKEPASLAELALKDLGIRPANSLEQRAVTRSVTLADGQRYLTLTVEKVPGAELPVVEVSPNLLDWYSGTKHTSIIRNDDEILKVRDDTPVTDKNKRFIRARSRNKLQDKPN